MVCRRRTVGGRPKGYAVKGYALLAIVQLAHCVLDAAASESPGRWYQARYARRDCQDGGVSPCPRPTPRYRTWFMRSGVLLFRAAPGGLDSGSKAVLSPRPFRFHRRPARGNELFAATRCLGAPRQQSPRRSCTVANKRIWLKASMPLDRKKQGRGPKTSLRNAFSSERRISTHSFDRPRLRFE